uniref:Uncharacterized protein n=1 Tax=Mastacembelus armatus TaxID=205130 RepID=A0A7N8Y5U5_9TELE
MWRFVSISGQRGTPYNTGQWWVCPPLAFLPFAVYLLVSREVTFDNVAVNSGSELLPGSLVEVLSVDDPHLFEESRLAALASAEQQDLYEPFHVRFLPGQRFVDLLGLS